MVVIDCYYYPYQDTIEVINCTIDNNYSLNEKGGAGINVARGNLIVKNSIVTNNQGAYGIYGNYKTKCNITFFDVWNNEFGNYGYGVVPGEGCISLDPFFVPVYPFNYHLTRKSPCRDNGIDAGVYDDFEGDPRPFGDGFDMGADEWTGVGARR